MNQRGVTLLLAIFISTIAISLGLGIFAIIFGELGISGSAKNSFIALYAADSGAECALYWDIKQQAFSTTTSSTINCADKDFVVGGSPLSTFDLTLPNDSCAHVQVQKGDDGTTVTSLGSNNGCDSTSPSRTVQRGLEVQY